MAEAGHGGGGRPAEFVPGRRSRQMAINVPTGLLRSFIAMVHGGPRAQARRIVFLSRSALSLQMKRGEDLASLARQMLRVNGRVVGSVARERRGPGAARLGAGFRRHDPAGRARLLCPASSGCPLLPPPSCMGRVLHSRHPAAAMLAEPAGLLEDAVMGAARTARHLVAAG